MGSGASAAIKASVQVAKPEELQALLEGFGPDSRARLEAALTSLTAGPLPESGPGQEVHFHDEDLPRALSISFEYSGNFAATLDQLWPKDDKDPGNGPCEMTQTFYARSFVQQLFSATVGDYDREVALDQDHPLGFSPALELQADGGVAGDAVCRGLKEAWVSPPLHVPEGPVAPEALDVAAIVNAHSAVTRVSVPAECVAAFNETWHGRLQVLFGSCVGGAEELEEFLATGRSNGWPMRLQLMALPPGTWFRVHAHPNLEFEHTLAGRLAEVRLANQVVYGGDRDFGVPPGTASGPWGPNLAEVSAAQAAAGNPMQWTTESVPKGHFLCNTAGSVHQSFTCEEGAILLLLWSGCHANIRPCFCRDVCPLLQPQAGWAE